MSEHLDSDTVYPVRSSDVEMANFSASGSPQEELEVPPLTSYVSTWRFWCKFLKWPVGFLVANGLVLFISSTLFLEEQTKPTMVAFFSVLTALNLGDAFVLYRAARHVEKQVAEFEGEASSESTFWSPHLVYAKVSKQLDSFFGQGRAIPKVTFLVNLLFALCALGLTECGMSVTSMGVLVSAKGQQACFKGHQKQSSTHAFDPSDSNNDESDPPIDGIPSDLQRWAYGDSYRYRHDRFGTPDYVHLSNGWTFFAGSKLSEDEEDETDDELSPRSLVGVAPNGTLKEYPDIRNPRPFVLINNQMNEFCALYRTLEKRRPRRHDWGGTETRM